MTQPLNDKADETPLDAETLEAVGVFLQRWPQPAADPAAKTALMQRLLAELPREQAHPLRHKLHWAWLILRSQVRVVHGVTWAASALMIALGALVTLAIYRPDQTGAALPLAVVAPLVAACGVAFLYGEDADPALELQLATPVSPRLILLARLALLFGFNLLITLLCSVGLSLAQSDISLTPLINAWFAPMTFLSALAFLMSVLFFDALVSVLLCLLVWSAVTLRHFVLVTLPFMPDLLHADTYGWMLALAPALVALALWRAEHEERLSGGLD